MTAPNDQYFDDVVGMISSIRPDLASLTSGELTSESALEDDPIGLDSLDFVELVVAVEEKYGVIAEDDELGAVITVGDLVSAIERWTSAG